MTGFGSGGFGSGSGNPAPFGTSSGGSSGFGTFQGDVSSGFGSSQQQQQQQQQQQSGNGFGASNSNSFGQPASGFGSFNSKSFNQQSSGFGASNSNSFGQQASTNTMFGSSPNVVTNTSSNPPITGFGEKIGNNANRRQNPTSSFGKQEGGFAGSATNNNNNSNVANPFGPTSGASNTGMMFGSSANVVSNHSASGWGDPAPSAAPTSNPFGFSNTGNAPNNTFSSGMQQNNYHKGKPDTDGGWEQNTRLVSNSAPSFTPASNIELTPQRNTEDREKGLKAKIEEKKRVLQAKIEEKKRKLLERTQRKKQNLLNARASPFVPISAGENLGKVRESSIDQPSKAKSASSKPPSETTKPRNAMPQVIKPSKIIQHTETGKGGREDLENAVSLVGTCQHMCPDDELLRRESENDIQMLETPLPGTLHPPNWTLRDTAVKRFRRSAADYKLDVPEWVRPPDVLEKVCGYLEEWVMDRDRQGPDPRFPQNQTPQPLDVYQFIWNRTRMIRKDFTLQNYVGTGGKCDARAIRCHERIARWHAMCEHQLSHIPDFATMQSQQNIQELGQTMKTLNQFYDDALNRSVIELPDENGKETRSNLTNFSHGCTIDNVQGKTPTDFDGSILNNASGGSAVAKRLIGKHAVGQANHGTAEAEMRGLYILLTINNDGGMEVLKYAAKLFKERPAVYHSKPVQLAMSIYKAKKEFNYVRFFRILRSQSTPYLFGCVMFKYVELIRKVALRIMSKTFGARKKDTGEAIYDSYPLEHLRELLCYEDLDEARTACKHYNITVKQMKIPSSSDPSGSKVVEFIFWRKSDFKEPIHPEKGHCIPLLPRKMIRTIESKLNGATRLGVCRGEVSGDGASVLLQTPIVTQGALEHTHVMAVTEVSAPQQPPIVPDVKELDKAREEERRKAEERRAREEEMMKLRKLQQQESNKREGERREKERQRELAKKQRQLEIETNRRKELEAKKRQIEEARKAAKEDSIRIEAEKRLRLQQEEEEARKRRELEERERRHQRLEQERIEKERQRVLAEKQRLLEIENEKRRKETARLEQIRRELEAKRLKEAKEWQNRLDFARKMLHFKRWRRQFSLTQRSQNSLRQIDPTFSSSQLQLATSMQTALDQHMQIPKLKRNSHAPSPRRVLESLLQPDRVKRLSFSELALSEIELVPNFQHSLKRKQGKQKGTGNLILLMKVAIVIPSEIEAGSLSELVRLWINLSLDPEIVITKGESSSCEIQSLVVVRREISECSDCDVILLIVPPTQVSLSKMEALVGPTLRRSVVLVLDNSPGRSSDEIKSLSGIVPVIEVSSLSADAYLSALGSACQKVATIFIRESCVKIDRMPLFQLAATAILESIWLPIPTDQNDEEIIIARSRRALLALTNEIESLIISNKEAWSAFPPKEFLHGNSVEAYFSATEGLPVDWAKSLDRRKIEEDVSLLLQGLDGTIRDTIQVLLTRDTPHFFREECMNMVSKRQFRGCLERILLWKQEKAEKNHNGIIYLPNGLFDVIMDGITLRSKTEKLTESGSYNISTWDTSPEIQPRLVERKHTLSQKTNTETTMVVLGESSADSINILNNENLGPKMSILVPSSKRKKGDILSEALSNFEGCPKEKKRRMSPSADILESSAFIERLESMLRGETVDIQVGNTNLSSMLGKTTNAILGDFTSNQ